MDKFDSMKQNLKEQLKHHSTRELEKDLEAMKHDHPEASKLGSYPEEHHDEEANEQHDIQLNHWGMPRH